MKIAAFTMLKPARKLSLPLLKWYDQVHAVRDMPWRQTRDPYAIWLSETMLQQTQVATVKPYYGKFLQRFPTIADLAAAPLEEVLALWAGLGYYRRAKHLHRAAQEIVAKHGGSLPGNVGQLQALPGIGRYTAGAVGSIAFGLPVPVVDGNVMRVLSRLTGYDKDISLPKHHAFFWGLAQEIIDGTRREGVLKVPRYGDVNQAMMELGATICVPVTPRCGQCPVRKFCRALAEGRQESLPVKGKKGKTPEIRGTAVIILREKAAGNEKATQEVLMVRRPEGGLWEGMWEFPVLDEKASAASIRKFTGLTVKDIQSCGELTHQLTHRLMRYDVVVCLSSHALSRARKAVPLAECRWVAWPLETQSLPIAQVVRKIASLAMSRQ